MPSSIVDHLHEREARWLHPLAAQSAQSAGRQRPASPCPIRTAFMRDRDRILHSKAFRRLKYKTQVFISPGGDHTRTRLTHSLEVAQIARTVARALRLNEDLTEAIALGHDLGHPPFGHSGEAALNRIAAPDGFSHTTHSVRIVTRLEPLNLTAETLDGLAEQASHITPTTLEAQTVEICDRMAYLHHDVEDAMRAALMQETDIPADIRQALGQTRKQRLATMVHDLITHSARQMEAPAGERLLVTLSPAVMEATMRLRRWMFDTVYEAPAQRAKDDSVLALMQQLVEGLLTRPDWLPPPPPDRRPEPLEQRVVDYVAGMTDRFALKTVSNLFHRPTPLPLPEGDDNGTGSWSTWLGTVGGGVV